MADLSATARDYRAERDGKTWVIRSPSARVTVRDYDGSTLRFNTQSEADDFARESNNRILGPSDYFARYFGRG